MKKYVISSANWKKKVEIEEFESIDLTIFEASTRAVEWALQNEKEIGILVYVQDPIDKDREFLCLSYKVLNNAGYYKLAELQREMVREEFNIDISQEELNKIVVKLQKASLKKSFCITKITEVTIDGRLSKVPVVCINLGLFEDEQEAKEKCKELNKSFKKKVFSVRKLTYNL